jgi:hypothetical protein
MACRSRKVIRYMVDILGKMARDDVYAILDARMANATWKSVSKRIPDEAVIPSTHNNSNQERPNSGHDAIQVAPPVCFLKGLVVECCHPLCKLSLFQINLALAWRERRIERKRKARRNHPSCRLD